jgi:hypothetical protein
MRGVADNRIVHLEKLERRREEKMEKIIIKRRKIIIIIFSYMIKTKIV